MLLLLKSITDKIDIKRLSEFISEISKDFIDKNPLFSDKKRDNMYILSNINI